MHARVPAFNNVGRHKLWQILEPQTCGLCFTVAELPRLDDLIRLAVLGRHDADGVLDGDARYRRVRKDHEERDGLLLPAIGALFGEVARTTHRQMRTRWERDEHVPLCLQIVQDV